MATLYFPKKTREGMVRKGISESDIEDVYASGEYHQAGDSHMMLKRYKSQGFEIGLYYIPDDRISGRNVVIATWKRKIT